MLRNTQARAPALLLLSRLPSNYRLSRPDRSHPFHRLQAILAADVVVRYKAHLLLINSSGEDVLLRKPAAELRGVHARAADVEYQNVRGDFPNLDSLDLRQALGENARIFVIFLQARRHFFERDQSRSSKYACLPHSAAQRLAIDTRFLNERLAAHQHRAHRSAQPLGQAKHNGIKLVADLGHGLPQRGCGIEDARAVQMNWQTKLVGAIADFIGMALRKD